ncbi:NAD(P)/FAD-dependent oxidoreductase [Chitinimonas sp. BJYL2]|uniref:NAD(P)/FAD-dependent oxidoreductase n=1 Tax=Chitinimonas sp. BJYL2 TaxID=2976696 RepID=UPI0022B4A5C6|nr:FAD-dependent oxidoreductase [Chitinimonas sp. BJYL2]
MTTPMHVLDVAVVGAGVAGVNCARLLAAAGKRIAVFDKARGAGGRLATRRGEWASFDHGAQYFTARDPGFCAWVGEQQAAGAVATWDVRVAALDADGCHDTAAETRFVGVPGMSGLCRRMLGDIPFFAEHRLTAMARDGDGWHLDFDNGDTAACRQLVLAVPAPQAAALLQDTPTLATLAAGVAMQPCWAVMLRFDQALPVAFDAAFVNTGPLSWVARNTSKPGRPPAEAWVLHGHADWSTEHVEAAEQWVIDTLTAAFAQGIATPVLPIEARAHRWRYAQVAQPLSLGCVHDEALGIGLAGDWLNGGRVEGAWCSGAALAARILAAS